MGYEEFSEKWTCPYCDDKMTTYFYYREHQLNVHPRLPPILNGLEEFEIEKRQKTNENNMKKLYGDVWSCTSCRKKGDRWLIIDHYCVSSEKKRKKKKDEED